MRRDRRREDVPQVLLAGVEQGQIDGHEGLHVALREHQGRLLPQLAPDLLPGPMIPEAQLPNPDHHIQPVARAPDLPGLGLRGAIDRPPEGTVRVAAAEAEVAEMFDDGERLDHLGPDGVTVDQGMATVHTDGEFRAIAHMGKRAELPCRFHLSLLSQGGIPTMPSCLPLFSSQCPAAATSTATVFPPSKPRSPPASVVLTLWLSMIPALGSGSRPTF